MISDRARYGLRGGVKSCTEESLFFNEVRFERTTEYNSDGRVVLSRSRNTDGSFWVTRYEYGASGQLLKITSGTGRAVTETHYSYDNQGRLQKIMTDGRGETPVSFRYGESGQKTKI